jgi:SAM-dependent methyltransferase
MSAYSEDYEGEDPITFADWFGDPPYKLNLGAGMDHVEGFIGIDSEQRAEPDLVWDLQNAPWPMSDDSVDEILAKHVVEHIHDLKTFFKEAYRVMQHGSMMIITVPHHCSDFFWGDPTHVRAITRMMLDLLSQKSCAYFAENKLSNTPLAVYWDVDFDTTEVQFAMSDQWKDKFNDHDKAMRAIATYNNIVNEVQFKLRCIKEG